MGIYKKYSIMLLMTLILLSLMPVKAMSLEPGTKAPQFNIKSGDDKKLPFNTLQGKAVIILYESKDAIELNRSFKNELATLLNGSETLKARTMVLSVIDCSSASWVIRSVWKKNLVKNSKKENLIVYGDWDGKMSTDYGMEDNKSNIVIIDRTGIIRFFKSGKLNNNEINQCKDLIQKLAGDM
ncbi:MAG: redoxin domain-containing protein [Proteobacteria bacterium]|nr:redoxin domain-containing protein [Pseudomonadota bacterium]